MASNGGIKRDLEAMKKKRVCHDSKNERPVWNGPIPDRYYYMVKNMYGPGTGHPYVVPFSDELGNDYEKSVRQIAVVKEGKWSLIESKRPLPITAKQGKMLSHGKVEGVKEKLNLSMPYRDNPGIEVKEEEVFI